MPYRSVRSFDREPAHLEAATGGLERAQERREVETHSFHVELNNFRSNMDFSKSKRTFVFCLIARKAPHKKSRVCRCVNRTDSENTAYMKL